MELLYFDICSGALVPDVHDVVEGGLQYEAMLLLQHCIISKGYFTLDELNQLIIQYYELGYMGSDRPSTINSDKLGQSTKQTGAIQVCMKTIVSVVSSHACLTPTIAKPCKKCMMTELCGMCTLGIVP